MQDPTMTECLPLILRDFINEEIKADGGTCECSGSATIDRFSYKENHRIPDARKTLSYLLAFWSYGDSLCNAAEYGALHLIHYTVKRLREPKLTAHVNTLIRECEIDSKLEKALRYAGDNDHADAYYSS